MESITEIKLGTVGSGTIVHTVLDQVRLTDGIRLVAVYSRTRETGEALACRYGAQRVYTDLDAFLADGEMNFVYIATPNSLHYAQAKKALLAGKNVILEKPFTVTGEQTRELVALAKDKNRILIDAVPTAFLPNLEVLKRQLPRIGRLKLVMGNYSQYSSRYDRVLAGEVPNIFNPAYAGGSLMDINFYNVYLNIALFGKPEQAVYYPNIYPGLADTSGVFVMQYPGFVSQSAGAKDTWGVNFFQIEGDQGFIYIADGANGLASIRVVTKNSDETFNAQENPNRWFYEVQNITRLVLQGESSALDARLETTLAVIETIAAARREAGILFPEDK